MDHESAIAELGDRRLCQGPRRALFYFAGCFMGRTDGCHVRAMQTLDLLVAAGLDVTIYSYRRDPKWPWTASDEAACLRRFPSARLVLEEGGRTMRLIARIKTAVSVFGPRTRRFALKLRLPKLSPALDRLKARGDIDVVVVSYAAGLTMLNGLARGKVIVDAHDLPALERIRAHAGALELGALLRLKKEVGLLAAADAVWCIAFGEFCFLREMLDSPAIRFVPPSVNPLLADSVGSPEFDLLFVGSDNRWNADALMAFLQRFAGWTRCWTLAIAGNVAKNARVRARVEQMPNVKLLGFQEDLVGLYRRTRAAICPVEGTGTKIKIVEALTAARPVFAEPGSVRGLMPGHEGCVFPLEEEAVAAILDSDKALDEARTACRTYAEAYSFERVRRSVAPDLLANPPPKR